MELKFTADAEKDREWWKQHGDEATKRKIKQMLKELEEHPRTGTGKLELLSGDIKGVWSRRPLVTSRRHCHYTKNVILFCCLE